MNTKQKRPNVIFILTDDQRYGTIGALGNTEISTPRIDELVARGTSFLGAHIPGGTASAVCMPSRAMINSGRTLFRFADNGKDLPEDVVTMGQAFRESGYYTHGIGKWHNGTDSFARSFSGGDDIFFGGMWDHWNVPVCNFRPDGCYDCEIPFVPNFSANQTPVYVLADQIHAGVHSTDLFTGDAVRFIENYEGEEPFFLYLSFLAPHDPRTMPEKFRNMYRAEDVTLPPNFMEMPEFSFGWTRGRDETVASYPRKPEEIRQHIADYYAMISHIDENVGHILDTLDQKGIREDTVIVFCGDNGLAIGQHGLMGKQNVYEHSTRLPLVMAGPGIPAGAKREQYVYLLDIYPTLCDLCGVSIPASVEGKSFARMFEDETYVTRPDIYYAFQARIRGVADGRYKLIEYRTEDLKLTQLFDLRNDPWEQYNMFDCDGYGEITARLRARMQEYREEWGEEEHLFGRQFWEQWRRYEDAALHGVGQPKGASMVNQTAEWGKAKKK
ncbi:MAG: sulfatase-like hydrolase/transferase [Clostridia bacterium]|nr:sulfatase-like hydrolase/transferase [Clostridia bacterium]